MRKKMKLLVLSCCAPCSCAVLHKLVQEEVDVTVYFYNPNIFPSEEYRKRMNEQKRICAHFQLNFVEGPYEPEVWKKAVKGLENEPERGERCSKCFYLRLKQASDYARKHNFDAFTSVLGVSRYKNLSQVNEAARRVWMEGGKPYLAKNWRKGGLEELRRALIAELKLYQQSYCGCQYSKEQNEKNRKNC